ncbi:hypothetical protein A6R68_13919 [Neotoma lepida]|uniref:Uncharacterized protein n=1 Tax=Neotoma lepida TaxID=56216 RepID=A0A1A6H0Z9_NEOLE|nr:hypothetical protein A6R68_13919 [Neotoma lepida]
MRPPHPSPRRHRRPRALCAASQPQQGAQLWKSRGSPREDRVRALARGPAQPAPPRLGDSDRVGNRFEGNKSLTTSWPYSILPRRNKTWLCLGSWKREGAHPERRKDQPVPVRRHQSMDH